MSPGLRPQEILAQLGALALKSQDADAFLEDAARLAAEALQAEFSLILEHMPDDDRFLVRAGIGWQPGMTGEAFGAAELESPAGFAFAGGKPVIVNDLQNEQKFRLPENLRKHGIQRVLSVSLPVGGRPFGVLEVASRSAGTFTEQDAVFLRQVADLLGLAIDRDRRERDLEADAERERTLRGEMNHRMNNMLMIVSSVLRMESRDAADETVSGPLEEASHRVAAVSHAHDRLFRAGESGRLDLGKYIEDICRDLDASAPRCAVRVKADPGIMLPTDHAISVALIVNELIGNAARNAYPDRSDGTVDVAVRTASDGPLTVSVRDHGKPLPPGFDLAAPDSVRMRLVTLFARQLGGSLEFKPRTPGTEFVLTIPNKIGEEAN